jgi:hypothetical protein
VDPCLLPDSLNDQWYRDFLETVLPGLLDVMSIAVIKSFWLQHERAPAHKREDGRKCFKATYPGRWTGRRGPLSWPHCRRIGLRWILFCGYTWSSKFMQSLQGQSMTSMQGLKQLWQLSMTTCKGVFQGIRCIAMPSTWNAWRPLRKCIVTTRLPFDVNVILKNKGHSKYVVQHFGPVL